MVAYGWTAYVLIPLVCFAWHRPGHAQQVIDSTRVKGMLSACMSPAGSAPKQVCEAFIGAASAVFILNGVEANLLPANNEEGRRFLALTGMCAPLGADRISMAAKVQAFVNWAKSRSDNLEMTAIYGVTLGLSSAWPCVIDPKR